MKTRNVLTTLGLGLALTAAVLGADCPKTNITATQ
jgi:hypothetical protein